MGLEKSWLEGHDGIRMAAIGVMSKVDYGVTSPSIIAFPRLDVDVDKVASHVR